MSKISSFFRKKKKNKNSKDYIQPLGDYPDFQQFQGKIFQISIQKLASTYATSRKNIPLIIKQLIDMIEESYIRKKGLFNTPKNFELLNEKVLLLNENGALNTLSIRDPNVLTSLLKLIFYYLPDPLLTSKLIEKWTAAEDVETISKIIEILPEVNQFVLAYLMRFLKRVSLESKFNKLNSNSLAEIFAPLIIWGEDRSSTVENSPFVVEKNDHIKSINQEKQKKKEQEIKTQEIKRENENEKSSDDEGSDSSSDSKIIEKSKKENQKNKKKDKDKKKKKGKGKGKGKKNKKAKKNKKSPQKKKKSAPEQDNKKQTSQRAQIRNKDEAEEEMDTIKPEIPFYFILDIKKEKKEGKQKERFSKAKELVPASPKFRRNVRKSPLGYNYDSFTIFSIVTEDVSEDLTEKEEVRIKLINLILKYFNQFKRFHQGFQTILIKYLFKKSLKSQTNERHRLTFSKLVLLIRILISEIVIYSKEFQLLNSGKRPNYLEDWNPVMAQIEMAEELIGKLETFSQIEISRLWRGILVRKKLGTKFHIKKKSDKILNVPDGIDSKKWELLILKYEELRSLIERIRICEKEIALVSQPIESNKVEKLRQYMLGPLDFTQSSLAEITEKDSEDDVLEDFKSESFQNNNNNNNNRNNTKKKNNKKKYTDSSSENSTSDSSESISEPSSD
ncbi:rho gtpase-activating protein [Anaeramoeba flamelloides]|uniref:Rho gtpase-activating protein n=1 Tax=Anaeramoeba flamelloides TaxID=1746091 RepID=A0AAV8A3M4_9EUKA|nr:rho gtpase-activating protein [Anaeramoeba flamelloides]